MKTRQPRFGLVGSGADFQALRQAFNHCDPATLVAVTELDTVMPTAAPDTVVTFSSYLEMQAQVTLDGVIVAALGQPQRAISRFFLERGMPVFWASTLGQTSQQVHEMQQLARLTGTLFGVGSWLQEGTTVRQAERLLATATLGEIVALEAELTVPIAPDLTHPAATPADLPSLMNQAWPMVAWMRQQLGTLVAVQALPQPAPPLAQSVKVAARSEFGVMGTLHLTEQRDRPRHWSIDLYGARGTLHLDAQTAGYRRLHDSTWTALGPITPPAQQYVPLLTQLAQWVTTGATGTGAAEGAIAAMTILEVATDALHSHRWLPIAPLRAVPGQRAPRPLPQPHTTPMLEFAS